MFQRPIGKLYMATASLILILIIMTSCGGGTATPPVASMPTAGGVPDAPAGNSIEIVSVSPPVPAGISIADPLTVRVRYNLEIPEGTLQIWFERFSDADCTQLVYNETGGSTLAGTLETANGGAQEISVNIPPLPLLEVTYVGVGVRLWTTDSSATLAEDMRYEVCYAVKAPPAESLPSPAVSSGASGSGPAPAGSSEVGAVIGVVYADSNANGVLDNSEFGGGPFEIVLADSDCSTTLLSTATDPNGNYAFFNIPTGHYCVIMPYAGGTVLPGYWQRVSVSASHAATANFGMQPVAAPPPPPTGGYCGDSTIDAAAGEQCDPPNLTNCTAACQNYAGFCGDGTVDASLGEQCDPPNTTNCTASCQTYIPRCGDGYVDAVAGEQCDPPNLTDCTAFCQIYIPVCGDYWLDAAAGEQCDPPNTDFCTAGCMLYLPNCGNSVLDIGEECDPPNTFSCTALCQNWP